MRKLKKTDEKLTKFVRFFVNQAPGVQGVNLCCRPSKSPTTSLFLRSASGSLFHYWQPVAGPQVHVELPATEGYVGTVSDDLPQSTQDVPVY